MLVRLRDGREVRLKRAERGDSEGLVKFWRELLTDPTSFRLFNYTGRVSDPDTVFSRMRESGSYWLVALHQGRVVGDILVKVGPQFGQHLQPHVAEMAYGTASEFRGTGLIYAQILFGCSHVDTKYMMAYVDSQNERSMAVLQRLGCEKRATLEEFLLDRVKNQYRTLVLFTCLKKKMESEAESELKRKLVEIRPF